ncbi:MAG: ABC-F family ATP-binding cassette domain-containing protein [Deltaproteobacteria bacterium]|uniref:ABC-F family ATP-binding cassette domain-containing protein n=1 Tax=Candidatus Desulfacyla euxinica TaxID=2841693 RepID=A0A8J6MWN0_9DELT|nr:ABC-F family ATP-binding cassette domain-containing protein [Candidatus Desulfacyla euxinica]
MSLVTVMKVSLNFFERQIFNQIGLQVNPGDRIGLVGRNGSGKTTLLRIIKGEIALETGKVRIAKKSRIGYLPQDIHEAVSGTLLQSLIESIPGRADLENRLKEVEHTLKADPDKQNQTKSGEKIAAIHQDLNRLDLEFPRHEAEKILIGLGFETADFIRPVASLSGGWKMRAALATLLYQKPDLLLLDEPTNHLDIPSVRWLVEFLQNFKGAMILVSHDREFLNKQVNRIVSFETEGMRSYKGNYDFYLKAREEEVRSIEARAKNQEQKIRDAKRFIERFRSKATKARQAQSKLKLVEKMELIETFKKEKTIHFSFPEVVRSGKEVVFIEGVSKRFGKNILYDDLNLRALRGERIAIIGPNGCGKTTLLKVVAGEIEADRGRISFGHKVSVSYFAQHHSDLLNPRKTVVEEVYQVVPNASIGFVRNVCGAFLFSGSDVDKTIGVLSGGERARVSLAKLLVNPGNFMLMDEPTNHLDIESSETLIEALKGYTGTLLFVSHNQSFVNRLATKIWDIRGQGIVEYQGRLDEYYERLLKTDSTSGQKEGDISNAREPGSLMVRREDGNHPNKKKGDRKREKREKAEKRQLIYETLKPIQDRLEDLEEKISDLETRQGEVEKILADPDIFGDKERSVPLLTEYKDIREELDKLLFKWEKDQDRLESAKMKLEG